MPCITISSLSYASGRTIVHNSATRLGYELIDQEVFQDAARASGLSEAKLLRAFHEAPSFFGVSTAARKRHIAHVSAALAKRLLKDDVIYHGPFGHVLIPGVSHVLKVRVFAQREDRVATKVKRDAGLSVAEAEKALLKEDKQRAALAKQVFGFDDEDTSLFDLLIDTSQVDVDMAVDIIANTVKLQRYQPMTYSVRCLENLELSLRARASLVDLDTEVEVEADNGTVRVRTRVGGGTGKKLAEMRQRIETLDGVKRIEVEALEHRLRRVSGGMG